MSRIKNVVFILTLKVIVRNRLPKELKLNKKDIDVQPFIELNVLRQLQVHVESYTRIYTSL